MIKDNFTFRWYDPVGNTSTEFTASDEDEFHEAAINAAIDYRLASARKLGRNCYYPFAHLEIRYGGPENRWMGMRLAWNCPPMHLPSLGSHVDDVCGKHPSDIERIHSLYKAWWNSIKRWTSSFIHLHITAAQGSHPQATVALD